MLICFNLLAKVSCEQIEWYAKNMIQYKILNLVYFFVCIFRSILDIYILDKIVFKSQKDI
jgi:hypothetical protein